MVRSRIRDMRAIQLELSAATHFTHRGHSITWPEMENGGCFDLFIQDMGIDGLEVECKSISNDKGRKIHRDDAREFHSLVHKKLNPAIRNLNTGLVAVLTIPSRIPSLFKQRQELAQHVIESILSARSANFDDGSDIRISEFDVSAINGFNLPKPVLARETIDKLTETTNREAEIIGDVPRI